MAELDNTEKYNRDKQIVYWNLKTLNNMHSLTEIIVHNPYPQLYTQRDRDWRDLFFLQKMYIKGKQIQDTFLSRSSKYISNDINTFDRISLYKSQLFQLNVIKHEFWTRVYNLKPITKEDYKSRKIVRNIVWGQRLLPYSGVIIFATIVNAISGIAKLTVAKRVVTYGVLGIVAEMMVRIKKSDKIFYSIPALPKKQLQNQRQMILQQSLIIDGKINSYGLPSKIDQELEEVATKTDNEQQKIEIYQALKYKVIKKSDLI